MKKAAGKAVSRKPSTKAPSSLIRRIKLTPLNPPSAEDVKQIADLITGAVNAVSAALKDGQMRR